MKFLQNMKPKIKLSKKKSFHNPLETFAPPLESLQINSIRTRKGSQATLANTILALNMIIFLLCFVYIILYLLDIYADLIICESHCLISGLDLFCCLLYILSSSFLIIAIKKSSVEYYRKFHHMIIAICCLLILKGALYFIFHEINADECIFNYIDYDSTIIVCGILVGAALMFMYFIRKLKINMEGYYFQKFNFL